MPVMGTAGPEAGIGGAHRIAVAVLVGASMVHPMVVGLSVPAMPEEVYS